jgi:hypothetical protein
MKLAAARHKAYDQAKESIYMFRLAGIVAISAALLSPLPLQAQHRAGGGAARGNGGAARAGGGAVARSPQGPAFVGGRPGVPATRPVVPPSSFRAAPVVRSPIVRSPRTVIVNPGFGFNSFGFNSFGYSPYGFYPYGYYPGYYNPFSPQNFYSDPYGGGVPGYSYSEPAYSEPAYVAPAPEIPAVSQNESDLSYEVGRLSAEIEQLRQQQALNQAQAPPPPQSLSPRTLLIFRDGRQVEIQNYAIVGQTLWVLDERNSSKIPLSDLDLDATQKENRSRGLRFVPPSAR